MRIDAAKHGGRDARGPSVRGANVQLAKSFDLPPGTYSMKVLVRLDRHDTLAFARKDFTVE